MDRQEKQPFTDDYWQQEGGTKWVDNIEQTEASLKPLSDRLLHSAAPAKDDFVLDVGCGGGATSIEIAECVGPGGDVLGVDISPPILAVANDRGSQIENLQFTQADAGSIDFGKARFDLIFSRFGVMFFTDPVAAFSNLRRSLKPSGRMVFLCWRSMEENPWMGEPANAAFAIIPPKQKPDPDAPGPFSLAEEEKLLSLMKQSGFGDIQLEAVDIPMQMGNINEAVDFMMRVGPAETVLAEATTEQKAAIEKAIHGALSKYETTEGVRPPAAGWIATARIQG